MKLEDCIVGRAVAHRAHPNAEPEEGTIQRVTTSGIVFVRYLGDLAPKATRPEDLTYVSREPVRVFGKDGEVVFDGTAQIERGLPDDRMRVTPEFGIFADDVVDVPVEGWETKAGDGSGS